MTRSTYNSFSDSQIQEIITFQNKLSTSSDRNISLSEAIINWISLGYAEDYRNGFFPQNGNIG